MAETPIKFDDSFDFSNPFMAASIRTKDKTYPLWTKDYSAGDTAFDIKSGGNTDSLKALSFLTEIVVELCWADIPKITATLSPPYEDAIKFLDSDLVEWGTNRLAVQFGYASGVKDKGSYLSPAYEGMLLQPDISIGVDSTIRLNAQGTGSFAAGMTTAGKTYSKMTIDDIAKQVMSDFPKLKIITDDIKKDPDSNEVWFKDKITYCQGNKTYYQMMKELIFQARCTFVDVPKDNMSEWTVQPRSLFLAKNAPDFILTMFHLPRGDLGTAVYPIFSASSPPAAVFLPGVQAMMVQDIDVKKKLLEKQLISDKEAQTSKTAAKSVVVEADGQILPKPDEVKAVGIHAWQGDPADKSFVQQAHSAFESASLGGRGMAFPLEIDTIGVPSVLPGMVCAIRGLGMRLDNSNYAVKKVVHTINSSGFSTKLSLINNAGSFIAKELSRQGYGPKSDKKPKEGEQGNVKKEPTPQT